MRTQEYSPLSNLYTPKKRAKKQSEGAVVNACIRWIFLNGCFAWVNKTGAWCDGSRVIRYGKKGSADIIGLTRSGRFLAVECKSAKGKQEPEQIEFQAHIEEKGGIYILAYSVDDLEDRKAELVG